MSDDIPVLEQQTYLAVPYERKEQAQQSLGQLTNGINAAGFDPDNGLWFAKVGTPVSKVEPWLPNPNQFRQPTHQDPTLELASILESAGLVLNDAPIFDGAIHRVSTVDDKSGEKSGVYAAYNDGHPSGWYQDHRNHSEPQKWHASFEQSDPIAKLHLKAHQANQRSLREITEYKRYALHAKRSSQAFQLMPPAVTNHAYLTRKGVQAFPDVGQDKKGRLVVPLMDENNQIHSLQRISGNGFKSLKKGAQKSGHFFVVGIKPLTNGEPILYAEGYSTAASIAQATGRSVVMTVDAGNMPKVAAKLKQHYPESQHLFLADDDHKNKVNKGLDKAREAAEITDGHWLTPSFIVDEREHGMTDFNDLHVSRGLGVVKSQIDEFMERCTPAAVTLIQAQQSDKAAEPNVTKATLNTIEQYAPITESSEIPKDKDANSYLNNQLSGVKEVPTTSAASDTDKSETKSSMDRTPSVESAKDEKSHVINNPAKPELPTHLAATYIGIENKYYFSNRPQALAFVDKGNKLQTRLTQAKVIGDLLNIAANRQWAEVKLTGSRDFRREAWFQAKQQGMKVRGYRPDEHDLKRLSQFKNQSEIKTPASKPTSNTANTHTEPPLNEIEKVNHDVEQSHDDAKRQLPSHQPLAKQETNQEATIKAAKEFCKAMKPQEQKSFMEKVKQRLQIFASKIQPLSQSLSQPVPNQQQSREQSHQLTNPITQQNKEQQHEYELER